MYRNILISHMRYRTNQNGMVEFYVEGVLATFRNIFEYHKIQIIR